MKKIFAIALALVMVLSMASAFAFCDVIDWSTTTNCGKGSVEVVTYAIGNKAGGNTYTATECAGAVNGEEVCFAIKVTVDANPNQDWWKKAVVNVSETGLKSCTNSAGIFTVTLSNLFDGKDAAAGTYYVKPDGGKLTDSFDPATTLFYAEVDDAASAKVCATLKSVSDAKNQNAVEINGYTVTVNEAAGTIPSTEVAFTWYLNADGVMVYFNGKDIVAVNANGTYYFANCDGKFIGNAGKTAAAACNNVNDYNAIMGVFEALNINWNSKISYDTAVAKLSKTEKVSDCATWNSDVLAVVNPDCFVMEIPKTGDASVLAWLF